ncbi:MAG: hypothetical protein Q9227_006207 [Pyrenula ochraceoflavens]
MSLFASELTPCPVANEDSIGPIIGFSTLAVLQLSLVGLWAASDHTSTRTVSIVASALTFIACLNFCAISWFEHERSRQPSALLNAYLLLTLVFDAAELRTLWLGSFGLSERGVYTANFAVKAIVLPLEAWEKGRFLTADGRAVKSPEETAGLYSQSVFWWLNTIIRRGFKSLLTPEDLYPVAENMAANSLSDQFKRFWEKSSSKSGHRLLRVVLRALTWQLLAPVVPRLALIAFTICQPLLLNRFLGFLQTPNESQGVYTGYGLIGAYGIVYLGIAVSTGFYWHRNYRALTMLRGVLITSIYAKTMDLSSTASNDAAAVTLMSADVERIMRGLREMHEMWANTPLFGMFEGIMDFMTALGCFDRIEKFLAAESRVDYRKSTRQVLSPNGTLISAELADVAATEVGASASQKEKHDTSSKLISVRDAAFGWEIIDAPVLRGMSFDIRRSGITMLIGPVASGKSTLLKGLLGEVKYSQGIVEVTVTDLGWCEQTPWLMNESVERNVTGFSHLDQALYDEIIYCCDLMPDIETFPDGDQTIVGSKGIVLSGGQKQRLALARALYSRKEGMLFDDIFSGLDAATEKNVFDKVFGPHGLLRRWGTSVVIATHAVNLLPFADHIIALGKDGAIIEQGDFQTLNSKDGYVRSLCVRHADDIKDKQEVQLNQTKEQVKNGTRRKPTTKSRPPDDRKRQLGDTSVYHFYFQALGRPITIVFLFWQICWAFFQAFPTVWLKWWTDNNARYPSTYIGRYLGVYTGLQIIGLFSNAGLVYVSFQLMARKTGIRLHGIVLQTVVHAPMAFFSKTDTGSLTNRFSQDMQLIDASLPLAMMCVICNLLTCVAQAVLIASATFWLALSFPALLAVFYALQKYYLRTSRQLRFLDLEEKAPVYTQFLESLDGLVTIRAFGWEKACIERNYELVDKAQRPFYLLFMVQRWLTLVLDLIIMALALLVVGVAIKLRGTVSVGFTGVSLTQLVSWTEYAKLTILFWTQLETSIGAVARIKEFSEKTEDENKMQGEQGEVPSKEWPDKGEVKFEMFGASYSNDSDNSVLDRINLDILPGEKVGICGRTGSGKSTMLHALFRLLPRTSGQILIDRIDISSVSLQTLRSRLNAIPQEPFFLAGTVKDNLDPFNIASEGACAEVLHKVGLWNVVKEKGGLEVELEAESMLSHGQRQLFCLARALLRPGKLVCLDEVSSSVDRKTDALMQEIIRREFQGRTIIAVAHRLETIADFDRVIVLDAGKVVECGPPQELLEKENGWFRGMWESGGRRRHDASNRGSGEEIMSDVVYNNHDEVR